MSSDSDRTKKNLTTFIRKVLGFFIVSSVDNLGAFPCKVVSQNADGSLELIPDDTRISSLSGVPIRYGVPGVTVRIANGGRALLQFAMGDPTKPYCTIWESASVTTMTVTATTINVNGGTVNIGSGANAKIARYDDLKTAFDAHVHTSAASGSPTTPPTIGLPTTVGSSKGNVA